MPALAAVGAVAPNSDMGPVPVALSLEGVLRKEVDRTHPTVVQQSREGGR